MSPHVSGKKHQHFYCLAAQMDHPELWGPSQCLLKVSVKDGGAGAVDPSVVTDVRFAHSCPPGLPRTTSSPPRDFANRQYLAMPCHGMPCHEICEVESSTAAVELCPTQQLCVFVRTIENIEKEVYSK